ncbi:hypothetical protein F4677DRAFT_397819 [Hypoxylon crocopeplum]|nr:hypothetical protein F4677DRAFT_397819 [Hypoxylon crocopeplum]
MARKKQKHQAQLTFEPVGSSSSPNGPSPANVRYTKRSGANSSPSRASTSKQATRSTPGHSSKTQSKLQQSIGPSQNATSLRRLRSASFMPRIRDTQHRVVADDSSDDSAAEIDDAGVVEEEVDELPVKSSQSVSTRLQRTVIDSDDDDDEPIAPSSALKRRRPVVNLVSDSDDDNDDSDDTPIIPPSSSKRPRPKFVVLEDSSDEGGSPAKKTRLSQATPGRIKRPTPSASSPTKQGPPKGHRSERQKKMELLRRRRAGEKIDKLTSSEDSGEERRGLYDTDPEEEFEALKEFDDEEEAGEDEEVGQASERPKKSAQRRQEGSEGEGNEEDDFIDDDDDGPLGAPADLDIPLQFTAQAHRPLKDQFPYVIEWLVHNRIDPAFARNDPVYQNAWRKLDLEVAGLASSKFASSAWKSEFYRALRGRPKMDVYDLMGDAESAYIIHNMCEACGRSKHLATFRITFRGHAYHKDTLDEVESESDNSDYDDGNDHESIDSQGMVLPLATKEWYVGAVCSSNAETAHSLIHWKHALKEWVEERLEVEGWMKAQKLKERERMKARKRRDLADGIVDGWREKDIVATLYRDFKNTLENARNKATSRRA